MATTLATAARNAACDGVVDLLDGGSVELQTSGNAVLATLALPTPAFAAASAGVAPINTVAAVTASAAGTVAKAVFKNSGGTTIFTLTNVTATGGGGDLEMSSTTLAVGDGVDLTNYSHTQPA